MDAPLFDDRQKMRDLLHHAAEGRRIRTLHDTVHLFESQRPDNYFMLFRRADDAAYQFDLNGSRHDYLTLSNARPRISAISPLSRSPSSALMVALTTLCGLREPMVFVSTFGIPTA